MLYINIITQSEQPQTNPSKKTDNNVVNCRHHRCWEHRVLPASFADVVGRSIGFVRVPPKKTLVLGIVFFLLLSLSSDLVLFQGICLSFGTFWPCFKETICSMNLRWHRSARRHMQSQGSGLDLFSKHKRLQTRSNQVCSTGRQTYGVTIWFHGK